MPMIQGVMYLKAPVVWDALVTKMLNVEVMDLSASMGQDCG